MAGEEGQALALRACDLQKVVGDRARQDHYRDELVGYLQAIALQMK
jgi:hypothetical protein